MQHATSRCGAGIDQTHASWHRGTCQAAITVLLEPKRKDFLEMMVPRLVCPWRCPKLPAGASRGYHWSYRAETGVTYDRHMTYDTACGIEVVYVSYFGGWNRVGVVDAWLHQTCSDTRPDRCQWFAFADQVMVLLDPADVPLHLAHLI